MHAIHSTHRKWCAPCITHLYYYVHGALYLYSLHAMYLYIEPSTYVLLLVQVLVLSLVCTMHVRTHVHLRRHTPADRLGHGPCRLSFLARSLVPRPAGHPSVPPRTIGAAASGLSVDPAIGGGGDNPTKPARGSRASGGDFACWGGRRSRTWSPKDAVLCVVFCVLGPVLLCTWAQLQREREGKKGERRPGWQSNKYSNMHYRYAGPWILHNRGVAKQHGSE